MPKHAKNLGFYLIKIFDIKMTQIHIGYYICGKEERTILTLPSPYILENCIVNGFQTFTKPFEVPQRKEKIKI